MVSYLWWNGDTEWWIFGSVVNQTIIIVYTSENLCMKTLLEEWSVLFCDEIMKDKMATLGVSEIINSSVMKENSSGEMAKKRPELFRELFTVLNNK